MATYNCLCGNTFRLVGEGSPYEFYIVGFPLVMELETLLDEGKLTADDMNTALVTRALTTYICDKCKRIAIDKGKTVTIYNIERVVVNKDSPFDEDFDIPGSPI